MTKTNIDNFRLVFKNNTNPDLNFPEDQHEKRFFRGFQPGDNINWGGANLTTPSAIYTTANALNPNIFDSTVEILGDTQGNIAKITATPATCNLKFKQNK